MPDKIPNMIAVTKRGRGRPSTLDPDSEVVSLKLPRAALRGARLRQRRAAASGEPIIPSQAEALRRMLLEHPDTIAAAKEA